MVSHWLSTQKGLDDKHTQHREMQNRGELKIELIQLFPNSVTAKARQDPNPRCVSGGSLPEHFEKQNRFGAFWRVPILHVLNIWPRKQL